MSGDVVTNMNEITYSFYNYFVSIFVVNLLYQISSTRVIFFSYLIKPSVHSFSSYSADPDEIVSIVSYFINKST